MAGMYPDNQELDIFGEKVQWPGVDSSGKFSNGSFQNPLEKPSFIPAETINLILDNLSELIKKLGGTPDNTSIDQLAKLINMASQGDYTDKHPAQGVGLVKTVNRGPNAQECQKNEPWAASPNWVYNLLLGNTAETEVNNVVSQALRARVGVNDLSNKSFQFRGSISKGELDNTVVHGSYAVSAQGYSGALLVFETHSSTGIVQFYKDGYQNEPWKYRHATDSDTQRWSEWMPFGIKLTTGTPNRLECERNTPWAASPNWVYNLLTGKAADNVNKAVTEALKKRVDSGIKRMNFTEGAQYIEWDNGLKLEAVSFTIGKDWDGSHGANINFPIAFKETPLFISSFRGVHGPYGLNILEESNKLRFLLSPTSFFVTIVWNEDVFSALLNGGLIVIGV